MKDLVGYLNIDPATGNRDRGVMRDVVNPGDGTGTPVKQDIYQDLYYSLRAILDLTNDTPDNSQEGVLTSQVAGSINKLTIGDTSRIKTITASTYTILDDDWFDTYEADTTSNSITITLPDLASNYGKRYKFVYAVKGSTNIVTIERAGTDLIGIDDITTFDLQEAGQDLILYASETAGKWIFINNSIHYEKTNFLNGVGIGIVQTSDPLEIYKNDSNASYCKFTNITTGAGSGNGFFVGIDGEEQASIINYENTDMLFKTNNIRRIQINADGKVGFGDIDPNWSMQIDNEISGTSYIQITNSTTTSAVARGVLLGLDASAQMNIRNYESTATILWTSDQIRHYITSDGKHGFGGELSPDVVTGGLCTKTNGVGNIFSIKRSDLTHVSNLSENDTFYMNYTSNVTGLNEIRANSIKAGIINNSQVLIFKTNAEYNDTSTTTTSIAPIVLAPQLNNSAYGATDNLFVIKNLATSRYIFKGDGTAYADVSWVTFSDKRLKEEEKGNSLGYFPYGLGTILQLKPKKYTKYSGKIKNGKVEKIDGSERTEIGFFAQDVYNHIPEACIKPQNENNSLWGWDDKQMTPVIVSAIQELYQELSTRIRDIEDKL